MDPIKRIRRSESIWRELLAQHARSGASVEEFCRTEGLNLAVFRRWRGRLTGQGQKVKARSVAKVAAPFIDIGAMGAGRPRFEVRLELGGGMILSIGRG